jgi:hypothetical protein
MNLIVALRNFANAPVKNNNTVHAYNVQLRGAVSRTTDMLIIYSLQTKHKKRKPN